ncbi:MAG: zinc-binding dehydrogenase [Candidatus Brocadiales bacterium]
MKAVVFYEHGGLDKLKYTDVPEPEISPFEALVRVRACALNHLDIWCRQGMPGIRIPLPHISGCETAGEISKVGAQVKDINVGDRVLVAPGICCGRCHYCLSGWDSLCNEYKIIGYQVDGGYAEFVKAPCENIIRISDRLSFEEWAAVPLAFLTAWHMLGTRANLKVGEAVLVHAAGSGIGSAAIQVAKLLGARVIATAGSAKKLDKAKELGADDVVDYTKEDFSKVVKQLTNQKGVDVVFEHIGPETWQKSLASLSKGGRLVTCGATSGPIVEVDLRFLFVKQLSILGSYMGSRKELLDVLKLIEEGKLKPVIDTIFPLKDAVKAQECMLDRKQFGKIVLSNNV